MAKSKATKPVKEPAAKAAKPAKPVKPAQPAKEAEHLEVNRSTKPEPEEPRVPGVISDVEIGHVAGDLWGALAREGEMTVAAIKKAVPAPGDLVMAALGWLAREHKLVFTPDKRSVKISLR